MDNSTSILAQFNQMQNSGYFKELERLKKENRNYERLFEDVYCLISYTQIDAMFSFIIKRLLDSFIPQFMAFIMQPPRKTELRQYCYRSMKASNETFSYKTYSILVNYFETSDTYSYDYTKIVEELGENVSIPKELTEKEPVIIMPLKGIGGVYGVIILSEKTIGGTYTEVERQYILHLFGILALTIQNGLHYESSITEPKTNLYTPDYFNIRLKNCIALSQREKMKAGVLMLDIDLFKHFNDTWGHLAGDKVLLTVADKLRELTRIEDCVARFGGEEFIILITNCSKSDLYTIAERIRIAVSNLIVTEKGENLAVTISIGGYHIDFKNTLNEKEIIEKADKALYESKQNGRNRTTIHSLGLYSRAIAIEFKENIFI
ncbi:MAG: hypothetical protein BKP49_08800 [Treponema sp. CETP13]|nr:MAG: hypothetical protein BKP49_08800 [Treponema sp. CETP13]